MVFKLTGSLIAQIALDTVCVFYLFVMSFFIVTVVRFRPFGSVYDLTLFPTLFNHTILYELL